LFFSVYVAKKQDLNLIITINSWMAIGLFVLFLVWLHKPYSLISKGPSENLVGFTTHHTGMGLLAATVSILLIVYGRETKRNLLILMGLMSVIVVIASGSREALVAVAGAIGWYIIRNIRVKIVLWVFLVSVIMLVSAPYIAPHTYERTAKLFSIDLLEDLFKRAASIHWQPGNQKQQTTEDPEQDTNMLTRILYWTYATERFLQSPIIGIGWGRFNDPHLRMTGTKGFVYVASQGERVFSPLQAHNSYLHLLCESGVLGLALMLSLWFSLFFRMRKAALRFSEQPSLRGYYVACQTLIVLILGAALTGHAVGAPTTGIPLFVIIGIGLSYQRHTKQELLPVAAV
jgi:O-antigen ligase